jgi:hypothetical protein
MQEVREHAAIVVGVDSLMRKLSELAIKHQDCDVAVGFTAKYALAVHEMHPKTLGKFVPRRSGLGVYWGPPQFGPKFLERPAKELRSTIAGIVTAALRRGVPFLQSLLLGGLRLQREAQLRVPVEYGNLRASAYTRAVT